MNGALPLAGVRVLDLSRVLAGPWCAMALGDLGAEVIKVEHPGRGDDTRDWGLRVGNTETAYFNSANRNKRSVAIDLQTARGPGDRARAGEEERRADPELQVRRHRQARPGLRGAARAQPGPGLLLDLRLRPHRPRGRAPRLRPGGAGRGRPDGAQRRGRPAAAEVRRGRGRPVHRHVRGAGHPRGPVRPPEDRQGTPRRDGAVRLRPDDHGLLRPGGAAAGRRPAALSATRIPRSCPTACSTPRTARW